MTEANQYRTSPWPISGMPPGIPYIIGNEGAERFSFYGMRAVLVVFMTQYMMDSSGLPDTLSENEAKAWYHLFVSAVYFTPLLGALLSDGFLGKYRTIIFLSLVYCAGHLALAWDHTRLGLAVGLVLIAIGAGGIKPCVSAHVGDQFGHKNQHLIPKIFGWFYFAINFGAFISMLLTPWLMANQGPAWAFAVPGLLMLLATLVFWSGRKKFVHIPSGGFDFVREALSQGGIKVMAKLMVVYVFIAIFWALFDQTGSAWVLQAQHMDNTLWGYTILPAQMQAFNALFVLTLIPVFYYMVYPAINRYVRLTEIHKISIGLYVMVAAFLVPTWLQIQIDNGATPHISWQIVAYFLLTASEVMVSITALELSYTQAPKTMKSFIMAFFMVSIAGGNLFTSAVNFYIQDDEGDRLLAGADYYWFFTLLMLVTAVLFSIYALFFRSKTILQETADD